MVTEKKKCFVKLRDKLTVKNTQANLQEKSQPVLMKVKTPQQD